MFIHRTIQELTTNTSYFIKSVDVVIEETSYGAKAIDRHGNLIHNGDFDTVFDVALSKCSDRCVVSLHGTFDVKKEHVISRNDVTIMCLGSKIIVKSAINSVFILDGIDKNVYRVNIIGAFIDCNGLANNGIKGYHENSRAPVDSMIVGNTIINAVGNGIDGFFFNTLIARNVCNFNGAGIVINGGQHVTLFDNLTYMNKAPGLILALTDTAYVIRHKSLSDGLEDTFWRSAIVLNGLKTHILSDFEIWTSNSSALYYAIRVWPKNVDDYYFAVIKNGMIRDEGDVNHQYYVRFEAYSDKHIAIIEDVDARQADSKYANSFEIVNDAGILITRNFRTSKSPITKYLKRWIQQPHRFLSSCSDLPAAGIEPGQTIICYDSTAAKYVLKVWDGSAWQTIG